MRLTDFKALSFDCYGTLIDWETGMLAALAPLTAHTELDRDAILQAHARHESAQQRQTPAKRYPDLLATVYRRLAEEWGVAVTWEDCAAYGRSVPGWPAFPDSAEALTYLKQHFKLVILSNVDNASFAASSPKLQVAFDAVYTAEDIGAYKPADTNFDYMLDRLAGLGLGRGDILHTAESLFHDHALANQYGLASCRILRHRDQEGFGAVMPPAETPHYDFEFDSMAALAEAHKREPAG